jgi:hypothetical protein
MNQICLEKKVGVGKRRLLDRDPEIHVLKSTKHSIPPHSVPSLFSMIRFQFMC